MHKNKFRSHFTGMPVGLIALDYDGTIARMNVKREFSKVPKRIAKELTSMTPAKIAIITTKDFDFIKPRTPFASAWGCVAGLEIRTSEGIKLVEKMEESLDYLFSSLKLPRDWYVEKKFIDDFGLAGISIEWKGARYEPDKIREIKELCSQGSSNPHFVKEKYFLDIFASRPDKGKALKRIKGLLKVKGETLYMGDSHLDNSAFKEADFSVCVLHGQDVSGFNCNYRIKYKDVHLLLGKLRRSEMNFYKAVSNLEAVERC
jgi:HAD superfamily hydrolase (TIGR01484 family)